MVPFLSAGTEALPARPQTSFCFFPLYSEPAPPPMSQGAGARHRHGGGERCAQEGGGLEWGWLPRSREGRGGVGCTVSYKVVVRPQALWRPHLGQLVCQSQRARVTPSHQHTLSLSSQPHNTHTGAPPPLLSSGLSFWKAQRHLLCHEGRAISRPERVGWGGSVGAGGSKA